MGQEILVALRRGCRDGTERLANMNYTTSLRRTYAYCEALNAIVIASFGSGGSSQQQGRINNLFVHIQRATLTSLPDSSVQYSAPKYLSQLVAKNRLYLRPCSIGAGCVSRKSELYSLKILGDI